LLGLPGAFRLNATVPFIMEAATWLALLEHHGSLDIDLQLEAAGKMFTEPARTKVQNLIRTGYRLLASQVLLAVIKAALLVSPAGTPARADNNKGSNPFTLAMLGVADRLGVQADGDGGLWGSYPADLSLEVARNQHFNADHNFGSLLARYQRLWHDLPSEFAGEPDAIDIEGVFEQITGVTLDDLLLVGVPATGAAERGRVRFERNYFYDNIPLPKAKLDAVLRLLATDKVTMRTLVRQESQASGFDWSYTTFRQFPTLQTDHGDLILLSPRVSPGAAHRWGRLLDPPRPLPQPGHGGGRPVPDVSRPGGRGQRPRVRLAHGPRAAGRRPSRLIRGGHAAGLEPEARQGVGLRHRHRLRLGLGVHRGGLRTSHPAVARRRHRG
jgi:hypothetical protein